MMRAIGITGQMGTGKSWLVNNLAEYLQQRNLPVRIVSVDETRRYILTRSEDHRSLREELSAHFHVPLHGDGAFDLQQLAANVFGRDDGPADFWRIAGKFILAAVETQMRGEGVRLLEWSRLIEDGFLSLVESVIVTRCSPEVQRQRLSGGDLPAEQVQKRLSLQMDADNIIEALSRAGKKFRVVDTARCPSSFNPFCDEVVHDPA